AKVRNQLLKLKQTGAYHGYVNKFRELQRVVELDELTAINIFVNGLTDMQVRLAIQRKQPTTLTAAVQEGFLEWELQEKTPATNQKSNSSGASGHKPNNGKPNRNNGKGSNHSSAAGDSLSRTAFPAGVEFTR
ncbi:hypothetical protein F441_14355, partial [Phytophthora nicotianae CJ01A1]